MFRSKDFQFDLQFLLKILHGVVVRVLAVQDNSYLVVCCRSRDIFQSKGFQFYVQRLLEFLHGVIILALFTKDVPYLVICGCSRDMFRSMCVQFDLEGFKVSLHVMASQFFMLFTSRAGMGMRDDGAEE